MTEGNNSRKLGKKTRAESEITKKKVLRAALKIFANEGFYSAKLRDISAQAGTTHSLIRHHFGSKDDLWKAVVDYGLELHKNGLLSALNSGIDDPITLFKAFVSTYIKLVAQNPELSKILLHDNSRSSPHLTYLMKRQEQLHDIIEPVFKNAQKQGYFKGFDHNSFHVYVRSLVETPIATRDMSNRLLGENILSANGIALHTERVLGFLFRKDD
jgi:AcrR family transcriptional regulator